MHRVTSMKKRTRALLLSLVTFVTVAATAPPAHAFIVNQQIIDDGLTLSEALDKFQRLHKRKLELPATMPIATTSTAGELYYDGTTTALVLSYADDRSHERYKIVVRKPPAPLRPHSADKVLPLRDGSSALYRYQSAHDVHRLDFQRDGWEYWLLLTSPHATPERLVEVANSF